MRSSKEDLQWKSPYKGIKCLYLDQGEMEELSGRFGVLKRM